MALMSMTGFGRCELEENGRKIVVEMKSVNNRFLDANIRMPRALSLLEETVRGCLKARLARGRVDVSVYYENLRDDAKTAQVDVALLRGYMQAAEVIARETGLENQVAMADLLRLPELVTMTAASEDMEELTALLTRAVDLALDQMIGMRRAEGARMQADIEEKLAVVAQCREAIEARAPLVVTEYKARLEARLQELLADTALDEARLANEVALFSDRCSIAEELARLVSHIAQTREMMAQNEPVGRKLDFIVQEFNREANTICSKANDLTVTQYGLTMKNEIEKIREQVQNIE